MNLETGFKYVTDRILAKQTKKKCKRRTNKALKRKGREKTS